MYYLKFSLEGGLYSQVVRICRSVNNTKFTNKPMVKDEYHNVDNEMNTKNEDGNDMVSDLVKDKDKTQPSETTEDTKKGKINSRRMITTI